MNDRPTPRTDANTFRAFEWDSRKGFMQNGDVVSADLSRQIERELDEVREQRDELVGKFTKLDKPKYSGEPMLDNVLANDNPEFRNWVESLCPTYWARYDLSAARIGWEAAITMMKGNTP